MDVATSQAVVGFGPACASVDEDAYTPGPGNEIRAADRKSRDIISQAGVPIPVCAAVVGTIDAATSSGKESCAADGKSSDDNAKVTDRSPGCSVVVGTPEAVNSRGIKRCAAD